MHSISATYKRLKYTVMFSQYISWYLQYTVHNIQSDYLQLIISLCVRMRHRLTHMILVHASVPQTEAGYICAANP